MKKIMICLVLGIMGLGLANTYADEPKSENISNTIVERIKSRVNEEIKVKQRHLSFYVRMSYAVRTEDPETIKIHNKLIDGLKVEIAFLSDCLDIIQSVSSLEEIKKALASHKTELVRNKKRNLIAELKSQMPRIPEDDMQTVINSDVQNWLASDPEMKLIQHLQDLILEEEKRTDK